MKSEAATEKAAFLLRSLLTLPTIKRDFSSLPGGAAKDGVRPQARGVNINLIQLSGREAAAPARNIRKGDIK